MESIWDLLIIPDLCRKIIIEEDGIHFKAEFYPVWATNMAEVATL